MKNAKKANTLNNVIKNLIKKSFWKIKQKIILKKEKAFILKIKTSFKNLIIIKSQ